MRRLLWLASVAACAAACGSSEETPVTDAGSTQVVRLDASCPVTIESHPVLSSPHVPVGTDVTYNSNPPTSGPHYPVWAAFQEYTSPVDRRYLVHDLEHGAVLLLYRCDKAGGCSDVVQGLRAVRDSLPRDPGCADDVRVRVVIAPDPNLPVPVAAVGWGRAYKADCVDLPSMKTFVAEAYAKGPENLCVNGQTVF